MTSLEKLVLAEEKLQLLTESDLQSLDSDVIHPDLHPLLNDMHRRQRKGEQEALFFFN